MGVGFHDPAFQLEPGADVTLCQRMCCDTPYPLVDACPRDAHPGRRHCARTFSVELDRPDQDPAARQARLLDEIGDVLFVAVNLARTSGIDVSAALRGANRKFEARFRWMEEAALRLGTSLADLDLGDQEQLWVDAKSTLAQR